MATVKPRTSNKSRKPNTTKGGEEKAKRPPKSALPTDLMVDAEGNSLLNDDNKLTDLPSCLFHDADPVENEKDGRKGHASRVYAPLSKDLFAESWVALLYRAEKAEIGIAAQQRRLTQLRSDIETAKQYGDKDTANRVRQAKKVRARLDAMMASLREDGVDIDFDDLEADLGLDADDE